MIILITIWKILKYPLMLLAVLIGIALIAAIFVKKDMKCDKEIVINKPKSEVYDFVKLLSNQDKYSKWAKMDLAMKKTFTGTDGAVGFISAWDSNNSDVGKGAQEIVKMEGDRIDYELRFEKPIKSTSQAFMTTTALSDSTTKVSWGYAGKMNYPLNLMTLVYNMDEMIGNDYEIGLKNLKEILEN